MQEATEKAWRVFCTATYEFNGATYGLATERPRDAMDLAAKAACEAYAAVKLAEMDAELRATKSQLRTALASVEEEYGARRAVEAELAALQAKYDALAKEAAHVMTGVLAAVEADVPPELGPGDNVLAKHPAQTAGVEWTLELAGKLRDSLAQDIRHAAVELGDVDKWDVHEAGKAVGIAALCPTEADGKSASWWQGQCEFAEGELVKVRAKLKRLMDPSPDGMTVRTAARARTITMTERERDTARADLADVRKAYQEQHDVWEALYVRDGVAQLRAERDEFHAELVRWSGETECETPTGAGRLIDFLRAEVGRLEAQLKLPTITGAPNQLDRAEFDVPAVPLPEPLSEERRADLLRSVRTERLRDAHDPDCSGTDMFAQMDMLSDQAAKRRSDAEPTFEVENVFREDGNMVVRVKGERRVSRQTRLSAYLAVNCRHADESVPWVREWLDSGAVPTEGVRLLERVALAIKSGRNLERIDVMDECERRERFLPTRNALTIADLRACLVRGEHEKAIRVIQDWMRDCSGCGHEADLMGLALDRAKGA
jgi:hypothetical protein